MNILMLTNTFIPHVGGVARSVQGFTEEFRRRGHQVLVAAPLFKGTPDSERDVVRFPAVQHFNGSNFSLPVLEPVRLISRLRAFHPEVVHSHHPFLLGGTALRIAATQNLPLVFTYHTMYDKYTHYAPGDSPRLKRFVVDLVTGYCNLCDAVIAPTQTVADLLRERGVRTSINVIPSGVDTEFFSRGDGSILRQRAGIPLDAFVVGHVGRLAPEKNLEFLGKAVARFLEQHERACFLLVGMGPAGEVIRATFETRGLGKRLYSVGCLERLALVEAYQAMDVFAFASHTETQGIVLAEALAAGVPVVAVDAPGAREIVRDGYNGRLLRRDNEEKFALALAEIALLSSMERQSLAENARLTAVDFDMSQSATETLDLYESLIGVTLSDKRLESSAWAKACRGLKGEWQMLRNLLLAAGESFRPRLVWEVGPIGGEENPSPEGDLLGIETPTGHSIGLQAPERRPRRGLRARFLGWLWAWLLRIQYATWRKRFEGLGELDQVLKEGRRVLFSFWHGKYVPLFALLRGRPACVFTSESRRGEVIEEICRRFGYDCVQIPVHGSGQALELMQHALACHQNGGIAVDGPLGPYHRVKRGVIKLASELDYVVVPASVSARRKRVMKHRWDRLELPALFTQVGFAIGSPMEIPPDLSLEEIKIWVKRLHDALVSLDQQADKLARSDRRHA
jgi:1,2-diacylglycerol 3-alpha-glucosyltransferase